MLGFDTTPFAHFIINPLVSISSAVVYAKINNRVGLGMGDMPLLVYQALGVEDIDIMALL